MQFCTGVKGYNVYAGALAGSVGALAFGCCGHALRGKADGAEGPVAVTTYEFYHGSKWLRRREMILRRDGYRCQRCKRYGRIVQATTVHHVKHLEDRPDLAYDPENLISVCQACHNALHPEKAAARSR